MARGACTDSTFNDPACPYYCSDAFQTTGTGIFLAYNTHEGSFCCGVPYNQSTTSCNVATRGSKAPFNIADGNPIWNRTDGSSFTGTVTLDAISQPQSCPSASACPSASSSPTASSCPTCSSCPTTSSNQVLEASNNSTSGPSITTVAAGIAVPLGVLLLAALAAIAYLWSQLRKARKANPHQPTVSGNSARSPQQMSTPAPSYDHKTAPVSQEQWRGQNAGYQPNGGSYSYTHEAPNTSTPVQADGRPVLSELGQQNRY